MNSWEHEISFPCIEVSQPIGTFYIGVIDSRDLIAIAHADIRRVEERDLERYLGIQRPLSERRVKELKQYVTNIDATFPTSIILAIDSGNVSYDSKRRTMHTNRAPKVARIIDGQHRIAGLEGYSGQPPFQLNVTVFVDMDIENQAMVFATINLAQTKVSKSLVYDLYDLTRTRSPQKTCHNIATLLNTRPKSPFLGRIKMLGIATEENQTLTQAAIVEGILQYISGDSLAAMKDRDLLLRGGKLKPIPPEEQLRLPFRNLFVAEKDAHIARVMWNFFAAVESRWPTAWAETSSRGNVLPRTNGFRALVRLLRAAYIHLGLPSQVPSERAFLGLLEPIGIADAQFTTDRYIPGTSGESDLYKDLLSGSSIPDPD